MEGRENIGERSLSAIIIRPRLAKKVEELIRCGEI